MIYRKCLLLQYSLFGILALIFAILVLLYCLGDTDFSTETIDTAFTKAHQNIFSVIFWTILLGPAGAILYRLNNKLMHYYKDVPSNVAYTQKFEQLLSWIPVRLEILAYGLMGNFTKTIHCWMKYVFYAPEHNNQMLNECAKMLKQAGASKVFALVLAVAGQKNG